MADQLAEDRKLVTRIDLYGKGLSDEAGTPLTEAMRQWALAIDDRRVS